MQTLNMKLRGIYSHPSHMSAVPPGALKEADNIVIDAEDLGQPRRGFKQYGASILGGVDGSIRQLIPYASALFAHVSGKIYRDTGSGVFVEQEVFAEPEGARTRSVETSGSLFLTSASGLFKLDAVENDWRTAGVPKPLDATATTSGTSGFLTAERSVAYRFVLFYTDANKREIVSAVSQRLVVFNEHETEGKVVVLTSYIPDGLSTEYSYRAYRSKVTELEADVPSDELQLVKQAKLTGTDISNGYFSFTDSTIEDLRGAALYTNESQEGILQSNERPPLAKDVTLFRGVVYYANVSYPQRYSTQLIGTGSSSFQVLATTGDTTDTSAVIENLASIAGLKVGMRATGTGIPAGARILSIDSADEITLTEDCTATAMGVSIEFGDIVTIAGREYYGATATSTADREFKVTTSEGPGVNIEETARELVAVVNRDSGNDSVYAYYVSGETEVPGSILLEARELGGDEFALISTAGSAFSPELPSSGTTESSSSEEVTNGVGFSKFEQPEAVPFANLIRVGSAPIKRIIAVRDSIFVFSDRTYRITGGDGDSNLDARIFDENLKLIGNETAVAFNNRVVLFSNQGVVSVSDGGTEIISRPIENELLRVSSKALFPTFEDISFACAYESSRQYRMGVPNEPGDTLPTRQWIYNDITRSWTTVSREMTCAVVNPEDDRLYFGANTNSQVFQERKDYARTDFADEEYTVVIASTDGKTITVDDTSNAEVGFLLKQGSAESFITAVTNSTTLEVVDDLTWDEGAATLFTPITCVLEWVPNTALNPGILKQFREATFIFRNADFPTFTAGFASNFFPSFTDVELEARDLLGGWGEAPWGEAPWGVANYGEQPIRTQIPLQCQRCSWLLMRLTFSSVFSGFALAGVSLQYENTTSRFGAGA